MDKVTETKLHFAKVFTKLRDEKPVEQIRIKDLCGNGGASRQTFYYHFIDKEDFLNWVFGYELDKAFKSVTGPFDEQALEIVMGKLTTPESFYRSVFAGEGACKDVNFLAKFFYDYEERLVKASLHVGELNKEQTFVVNYHSYALAGALIDALNSKDENSSTLLADELYVLMPPLLRDAYVKKLDR